MLAVALVAGGILTLQWLVPAERDSPAVVTDPNDTFTLGPPSATSTPAGPAGTPSSPAASPTPSATPATRPAVTVLNNSRVTGLAAKAARDFAGKGWRIASTGNLSGRLARTTVYYGAGQRDAAAELRAQFPAIMEMAPRYAGLPGDGGLTVVVTRDYPH